MADNIWRTVFSISRVQARRSTPSTVYQAINTAHGLYAAFYACLGIDRLISLTLALWLYAQDFIIARETSTFASTQNINLPSVFMVSPIEFEMSLPGSPAALRGSPLPL
eukprot:2299527-Pleurochrysis_carterae.AAC.1